MLKTMLIKGNICISVAAKPVNERGDVYDSFI